MLIPLLVGAWVFFDARSRGKESSRELLWGLGTFFLLIVVLPLWIFLRPSMHEGNDPHARRKMNYSQTSQEKYYCSNCQCSINGIKDPRFCPYCGQKLTQDSPVITIDQDRQDQDRKDQDRKE